MRLLSHLLTRFVENGRLTVITADGARHVFGTGKSGPSVTVRMHDRKLERDLFFNPELTAAEAYMDGRLSFEDGTDAFALLSLFSVNRKGLGSHPVQQALRQAWRALRRFQQSNPIGKAKNNVSSHYDHPVAFYRLWLDETMTYSCAYFRQPDEPLADAQRNKFRHIAAKLKLSPGIRVAEIGSGWGGLAIYMAKECGAQVTAINVSPEQLAEGRRLAAAAGVADRIDFREVDYRQLQGKFDRVVSVGMMEHVGVTYYEAYFTAIRNLLDQGGFALVQAIGRMSPPGTTAPFIRKHIFPGGYVPALSEVLAATERTHLWVSDCEVLRLHYYWTIRAWRRNFMARRAEVDAMMGAHFGRMWEFYLAAVELGFLHGSNMVFQLLLSEQRDDVPVLRDYMFDAERALAALEGQ